MSHSNSIVRDTIKKQVENALSLLYGEASADLEKLGTILGKLNLDRPADSMHGDYSTNIALIAGKILGIAPVACAVAVTGKLNDQKISDIEFGNIVEKIEVAGPGFINFYLKAEVMQGAVSEAISQKDFGKSAINAGKKIAYEYTDPNPFKVFHIGHLMANMIGETLSRLGEYTGADIRRFCYQGDLGRHVALFIYGLRLMDNPFPTAEEGEKMTLVERMYYMGTAYAKGATYAKDHKDEPEVEEEIQGINKKLYGRLDEEINTIYDLGLEWSLEYFESLYELLGTKFDQYFFESKCVEPARILIADALKKGIFTESDGAIVFEGEKFSDESKGEHLHTRVFITKYGLPTYDAKDLGLAKLKYEAFQYDKGIYVTANEQDEYFKVNLKAQSLVLPELVGKNIHISHGMLKLPTGKMSSRTGDVVSAQELLESTKSFALEVMKDREMDDVTKSKVASQVAIAGIKYLVLRQGLGKDVIYDAQKALSFEGDSGPYLQYTCVRARAVIAKAKDQGIEVGEFSLSGSASDSLKNLTDLTRKIFIFPEIIERAYLENSPHTVATYVIELAGMFNAFYANNQIIDVKDEVGKERSRNLVALTQAIANVLASGLYVLGIEVPEKM